MRCGTRIETVLQSAVAWRRVWRVQRYLEKLSKVGCRHLHISTEESTTATAMALLLHEFTRL